MGSVAGAEPAAKVTGLADGHATQVSADACCCQYTKLAVSCCGVVVVVAVPNMISHSGFWTRSLSAWGSRRASHLVSSASLISPSVRWRMKTGLPRHLIMTCAVLAAAAPHHPASIGRRTFLPSGMAARSISTLAWAKTSAEADMLTRKSVAQRVSRCAFHRAAAPSHPQNSQLLAASFPSAPDGGSVAVRSSAALVAGGAGGWAYPGRWPSRRGRTERPWCRP